MGMSVGVTVTVRMPVCTAACSVAVVVQVFGLGEFAVLAAVAFEQAGGGRAGQGIGDAGIGPMDESDVPMASGTTANLIHGIPEQIAAITSFTTLLPGDVIMTGTPNASGHLDPGDEAIVHVEGIGDLRNVVVRG